MPRTLSFALIVLVAVVAAATAAYAHTWTDVYTRGNNARWSESNDHQIRIYNEPSIIGPNLARLIDGARSWEGISGAGDFDFDYHSQIGFGEDDHECQGSTTNRNPVWGELIDGMYGTAAETDTCVVTTDTSKIRRYTMVFDLAEPWYTGTGSIQPAQVDFWSVAAHEFGHAHGFWEHFSQAGSRCPNTSWHHTMCSVAFPGTTWDRTLNTHDVHTFIAAYGP